VNAWGQVYGPNYWLQPPYLPFNGMIFARQGGCAGGPGGPGGAGPGGPGGPGYPSHPYARSPRDFFMLEQH
jgi:hypothetical protein